MKRHGNLYDEICSFENLWKAARKAERGKRFKPEVTQFNYGLETELTKLRRELLHQTYRPGECREFFIFDRKQRLISAAPYRDRVVHHALCNVIEPIFERTFIHDSYACRKGKGTHAAVDRLQQLMQANRYVLKCDIQQYFASVDQALLLEALGRKIKCQRTLWLVEAIIAHCNDPPASAVYFPGDDLFTPHTRRRGIPIGNQTSQFFANVYLNSFDHWVTETHPDIRHLRYVDDFVELGNDKGRLRAVKDEAQDRLAGLRLCLHATKCQVSRVSEGVTFLGYRIFPDHIRLRADNPRCYGKRLRWLARRYAAREIELADVNRSVQAWIGHAQHADTKRLRTDIFREAVFCRGQTDKGGACAATRGTTTTRTTTSARTGTGTIPTTGTTTTVSVVCNASH